MGKDEHKNYPTDPLEENYFSNGDVDIRMVKTYKTEEPLTEVIENFKEIYDSVDLAAIEVLNEKNETEVMEPVLSVDREGTIYPVNIEMVLDNEKSISVEQYREVDPMGNNYDGDDCDGPYIVNLHLQADEKEKIREVFKNFYDEYNELLEDYDFAQQTMEANNRDNNQSQSKKKDKMEKLTEKYRADIEGYSKEDIALPDEIMNSVEFMIEGPLKNPELYKKMDYRDSGIILAGKPGVGKTLLAKVMSAEADANMYSATVSDIMSKYVGQSARNIDDMFKVAKNNTPSVIFLDEADSLLMSREESSTSHNEDINMVNTLLNHMDGMGSNEGVKVIAATNMVDNVDRAFLRPGRFGEPLKVEEPNKEAREKIYRIHTLKQNEELFDPEIENYLEEFAEISEGFTGAHIAGTIQKATEDKLNKLKEQYGNIKDIPPEEMELDHQNIFEAINDMEISDDDNTIDGFVRD